jgi:transposase
MDDNVNFTTNNASFKSLNIPISEIVYSHNIEDQKQIYNYLSQLDEQQKKAYIIAYNHLGSSFNICKSNGFKSWKIENYKK